MVSTADKTTKSAPAIQQKAAGTSFFRKAGEEGFFSAKENPAFFGKPIRAKLTVSTPDDPQEKEADAVAERVMRMQEPVASSSPLADKKVEKLNRKEEEELQTKSEAPLIDKLKSKQEPEVRVQTKACSCGTTEENHAHVNTKTDTADSTLNINRSLYLYPSDVMRQSGRGPPATSLPFEQSLAASKGEGSAMPAATRQFMESRFQADFSGVRIHTDATAVNLSRSVQAQAFAHGNDIYFNSGKYSPETTDGITLLAHELTHTIQQGASKSYDPANNPAQVNRKQSTGIPVQRSSAQRPFMVRRKCDACEHEDKLHRKPLFNSSNGSRENDLIQLKCAECEKEATEKVQLKLILDSPIFTPLNSLNALEESPRAQAKLFKKQKGPKENRNDEGTENREKVNPVQPLTNNDQRKAQEPSTTTTPSLAKDPAGSLQQPGQEKALPGSPSTDTFLVAEEPVAGQAAQPASKDNSLPSQDRTKGRAPQSSATNGVANRAEPDAVSEPVVAGREQPARPTGRQAAPRAGNGQAEAATAGSPVGLLRSLGTASYSGFAQAISAASAAVPQLQQNEKDQLAQNLPRIPKPTGLPATTRNAAPAGAPHQVNASSLQVTTSGEGTPQQNESELPAYESFSGSYAAVSVAEPVSTDEDSGSWWSWLTSRISSFIGTLPTTDSGVSTDAGERPEVNLSGEADPQQNEARRQIADGDVSTGVNEGDKSTLNDFGEDNIYPSVVPEVLRPSVRPAPALARTREVQQYPVPEYARAPYDQATQPLLASMVNEKAEAYQHQQEHYQEQSLQIRQEGLKNIEQENLRTQSLQQQIQLSAQNEVNAERQRWRQENDLVQQTYADQSEVKRVEVNTQIQTKKQTAEQEADAKLNEAERDAEREKQKAEAEAQRKKQEAENKPESWWESFKGSVSSAFNAIRSAINAVFDALREAVRTIIRAARALVNTIIDAARNAIIGLIRAFGDALKVLVDIALAQFPEIAQRARAFIDEQVNHAVDAVTEAAEVLKDAAGDILDYIGDTLDELLSGLQDMFNEYMDWLADLARGLVDFIENGISIALPDMTLFDRIAGNWDLPKLSTGDIPLWEERIEDPDDPCIFIAANVFVRGEMDSSLSASLGPGTLSDILMRLNPFASFYQGSATLRIPASGSMTLVLTGVIGGKAFYTCGDIVRIEGGLEGTGTAGLDATFLAYPTLTYDNGDISFTAEPKLEACLPLSFSLDAIARASLLDEFDWNGRWHLFDTKWSNCWNLLGAGSGSGRLPGGGGESGGGGGRFGGGGAGGSFEVMAQSMRFNPEPLNLQEILPSMMGTGPEQNVLKAAKKGICDKVDKEGNKVNPCEDEPGEIGPAGATYACAICKCSGDKECGGGRIHTIWMGRTECNRNNKKKAQDLCNHDRTFLSICDLNQNRPDKKKCMVHHHDFACSERETEDKCKNRAQQVGGLNTPPIIKSKTQFRAPDGSPDTRTEVGVGEQVEFTADRIGDWTATEGTPRSRNGGKTFDWTASKRAATVTINFTEGGNSASMQIKVVEPKRIEAKKNRELGYPRGRQGAGMKLTFNYFPKSVSFGNVEAKEVSGPASNVTGYFKQYPIDELWHDSGDTFFPIAPDNKDTAEDEASIQGYPAPWSRGTFDWIIPNHFKVKTEGGNGKEFTKVTQAFMITDATGNTIITKAGERVERSP